MASVGSVLSIIHDTQPLSGDEYYKDNLQLTSTILSKMSKIGTDQDVAKETPFFR